MGIARTIAKNSFFNIIANASDLIIALVVGIVLARSLGTEQYGLYAYLMWLLGLTAIIASLGLKEMSKRFIAEASGHQSTRDPQGLARMTLILRGVAALFVCFVIIISSGYWARLTGDSSNQIYFILIAFTVVPHALTSALIGILRGFQKYEYGAYVMLGTGPLRLVLIIIFMVLGFGIREVLSINIAVWVVGVSIGLLLLQRLIPLKDLLSPSLLDTAAKKRALKYALTMAGILFVDYLAFQQAEVFFIGLYCPVEEVGFYHMAFRLASMAMMLIPSAFALVLLPAIAEQFGKGDMEKIRTIYLTSARYLMIVTLPLAAGMITLAGPIIILLYGTDYAPAIILMQIIIVPMAIFTIGHAAGAVTFGINRPGFILKINVLMAFLNIGLSVWLISRYGVLGAAIAKPVPLVLVTMLSIGFASRRIGATWPVRDMMKIALASSIMGLAVYAIQSQLGAAISLALGIPLGVAIYVTAILFLRVITRQDLAILNGIQDSLPFVLRKHYSPFIRLMERIMVRTGTVTEQ